MKQRHQSDEGIMCATARETTRSYLERKKGGGRKQRSRERGRRKVRVWVRAGK